MLPPAIAPARAASDSPVGPAGEGVTVSLANSILVPGSGGHAAGDILIGVEGVIGSAGNDDLDAVFAPARKRPILDSCRPQDVVVACGIVKPTASACARPRQGASLRSAHAPADWLLVRRCRLMTPTCCGRRPVQIDALRSDR